MKNYLTIIAILYTTMIISVGCEKSDTFKTTCNESYLLVEQLPVIEELTYTAIGKWIFESFQKADGNLLDKEMPPASFRQMWLELTDTSITILTPTNSCYRPVVKYYIPFNNAMSVEEFICTEVGGSNIQLRWEEKMLFAINNAKCYDLDNERLILYFQYNGSWQQMNFNRKL